MLSKRQKIVLIILVSFVLSVVVTLILQYAESTKVKQLTFTTTITISNETRFSSPFTALIERGFFDSVGDVYVYTYSPYTNYWNTFKIWMSLDNSSWEDVPFLEAPTNNLSRMAYLGRISLYDPQMKIYVRYYVPPQTILLPSNVTKEDASNIFAYVLIKRRATPSDTGQWILTFFTFFSISFGVVAYILDSYTKNSDKKLRTIAKKKRKKGKALISFPSD